LKSAVSHGVDAAVEHGMIVMHPSGGYVTFTQAGAELFA
jgi:hypothetical protein